MKLHFYSKQTLTFFLLCLGMVVNLSAQFTQQGSKLVGTGIVGVASQGWSVALSNDGNTALVGIPDDNTQQGGVLVYTRSGSTWTQQGSKLVGTGAVGAAQQGYSVALSSDGNTALVGGPIDNSSVGAVWVFTRSGSTWTQQGSKLVSPNYASNASQGWSVALSDDGNTALIGGPTDNSQQGAAWVWTRSGSTWTQQGGRLIGTGNTGAAYQGNGVALSGDGNTALVGGPYDNSLQGAVWVFTRSGSTWTQQGAKLVGASSTGAFQGRSLALSDDGNTALVGGPNDNSNQGAAWVWTRSGSTWTQQGSKLVGTGNTGAASQNRVALSGDGNTALVGGGADNSNQGAVWVFTRSGSTWTQQGSKLVGMGNTGAAAQGRVALSGDGTTALVGGPSDNSNQGAVWVFTQSALPIELLSFSGKYIEVRNPATGGTEGGNLLTWQTANEVNNKGFEIERLNGNDWQNIGFLKGNNKASTYQFLDDQTSARFATSPTVYYRLRQIDNDGKETVSKVIALSNASKNRLKIYPSVTSSFLTIETDLVGDFQIFNLLGQQVLSGKTLSLGAGGLDVSALPKGTYILKVGNEVAKFIKQ